MGIYDILFMDNTIKSGHYFCDQFSQELDLHEYSLGSDYQRNVIVDFICN